MNFLSSNEINQVGGGNFKVKAEVFFDLCKDEAKAAGVYAKQAFTIAISQSLETYTILRDDIFLKL